jgi:hypothetical protein
VIKRCLARYVAATSTACLKAEPLRLDEASAHHYAETPSSLRADAAKAERRLATDH